MDLEADRAQRLSLEGGLQTPTALGSGQAVSAALSGPSLWSDPDLQHLWERPWERQLKEQELLFLEAHVLGVEREALILEREGQMLRMVAPGLPAELPARDNLSLLARAPRGVLRWLVRLHPSLERTVVGLAVSGLFPEGWEGRAYLGLDRLMGSYFQDLQARPRQFSSPPALLPWASLEQRLWRVAQGGRGCLRPDDAACQKWREHQMLGASRLWRAVVAQAQLGSRNLLGHWVPESGPELAVHWLAAMTYLEQGRRSWLRECWDSVQV